MSNDATCFRGSLRYTIADRDGYDDELYTVHSLLRFYADGTLDCLESDDGCFDEPGREKDAPHLRGTWSSKKADTVTFSLERVLPVEEIALEAPNGGSDHHFYPSTGKLDCCLAGAHHARCDGDRLQFVGEELSEHTLLGERTPGFPR